MKLSRRTRETLQGYAFVAPAIATTMIFLGIASVAVLFMSFSRVNMVQGTYEWIGLNNYRVGFTDSLLHRAIRNTLVFSAVVVPVQTFLSLVVAAVLNSNIKFKKAFRAIIFLPTLTSSAALTMIFMFMFSMRGPVNSMLISMGLLAASDPINFLRSSDWSMRVIMIMNIWSTIPFYMTLYLASLQELPNSMYEAASIDGASEVKKFFYITIPYLRPITTFVVLTGIIGTMQMFDQAFIFSGGDGGPASSTMTIALLIYRYAFGPGSAMGYASMIAICLMVIILTLAFIVNRINKEERVY
ncbi:MAG: sugar ABC transporter permease [Defluviitaleaceae bacterium]|nr:sugar ABC transporter permease [Defluviitaleaceae bacterium]